MKKLILFVILLPNILQAQYSTKTEFDYLKLINQQGNKKLINDNIKNAVIKANTIILNTTESANAFYFNELAKSCALAEKPAEAIYFQLVQRVFYPNDSLSNSAKSIFIENGLKHNLTREKINYFWKNTKVINLPKNKLKISAKLLKLAILLYDKSVDLHIKNLGLQLKKQNYPLGQWYKDWAFLTEIKVKEKNKKQMLTLNKASDTSILLRLDGKLQRKAYTRAIRYYTKTNALTEAKTLLKEYKHLKLPFFKRFAVPYKKIRILLKAI